MILAPPLLLLTLAAPLSQSTATEADASALVQGSVRTHHMQRRTLMSDAVKETQDGPVAYTELGAIRGASQDGYNVFRGVPYVEKPARFEPSKRKEPWAPQMLEAKQYGPGCIGAHTGVPESEDCLRLNIWLPKGGQKNMPVVVYFHGGINQHGSGQEALRQGDLIVQSARHPTIWINFDFRLGIFGWIYALPGSNFTNNVGLLDQQEALRWVQRNIAAFGGDPTRVTLQGQSEGCGIILTHMVAPGSASLFHRAAFHSPPADMWSRSTNFERTKFMIQRLGCNRPKMWSTVRCLKRKAPQTLWNADWVSEELSRNPGSPNWISNFLGLLAFERTRNVTEVAGNLGWHTVVDGITIPGEPRELIPQGRWNRVPVLITISKNESFGVFPGAGASHSLDLAFGRLLRHGDLNRMRDLYDRTLAASGIQTRNRMDLEHQMITDKMWTCDCRSLAQDIERGGGKAYLGMFWHSPKFDPVGTGTNAVCSKGATCHAAEMLYVLPQGHGAGIPQVGPLAKEAAFATRYSDDFLAFAHGGTFPWVRYNTTTEPITFYDELGTRVVPGYRREQCKVLDSSMGESLPPFMRAKAKGF